MKKRVGAMGRRIKIRVQDSDSEYILNVRDDRSRATKVAKTGEGFKSLANSRGIVSQQAKQMKLFAFTGDGQVRLNKAKIKQEATALKEETLAARFYPEEYNRREVTETANNLNISEKKARNIIAREYQARARAILAASKAGDVKIDRSTKAILNKYNRGDYEGAIYGNVDEGTGTRQYAQGRYHSELGFAAAERKRDRGGSGNGAATQSARDDNRIDFIQNVQLVRNGTSKPSSKERGSRFKSSSVPSEPSKPKDNPFADLMTDTKKKSDDFIPF